MSGAYDYDVDQSERDLARELQGLLGDRPRLEEVLMLHVEARPGTLAEMVEELTGSFKIIDYASEQLNVSLANLHSLEYLLADMDPEKGPFITLPTYGAHTLIRAAIETAAMSLWILEPENGKLIVKRGLEALQSDFNYFKQYLNSTGRRQPAKQEHDPGIAKVAQRAGTQDWSEKSAAPSYTSMLKSLERHNPWGPTASRDFLATWQLCSGHAHGKSWATLVAHDNTYKPIEHADLVGYQSTRTLKMRPLVHALSVCCNLLIAGVNRYVEVCGVNPDSNYRHPLPVRHEHHPFTPMGENWFVTKGP